MSDQRPRVSAATYTFLGEHAERHGLTIGQACDDLVARARRRFDSIQAYEIKRPRKAAGAKEPAPMNLEWLLWDWEDDSRDETDADKGVAMPFAWELIDLDIDSSARPSEQIRVKRRKGRVMQWLSGGGKFEGDALGKVVGVFADPEEAKKAVEAAVRTAKGRS